MAKLAEEEELIALAGGNNFVGVIRKERLSQILKALEAVPVSSIRDSVTREKVCISARVAVYGPDGTDTSPQMIMHAIEPALKKREFVVYYQPKVDMKSRRITGAEALIRWNHNGTLVPPMDFIPISEKTGQVQQLDFYVLETVCGHIAEWIEKGIEIVPISVNFSKHHFVENTVAEHEL